MFDIGWLELIIIGIVALIVVGPKDLPGMFRTVGRFMGKARAMAREFQRSMEEAADETGLKDAAKSMNDIGDIGMGGPTKSAQAYAKKFMTDDDADAKTDAKSSSKSEAASKPKPKPKAAAKAEVTVQSEPEAKPASDGA